MRDPNRIDGYCDRLKEIWKHVPDWRFGQLMSNILCEYYAQNGDPFFIEDEDFFQWMEEYMQ